jgi:hypothetical protein
MPDPVLPYPLPGFCHRQLLQFGVEEEVQVLVGCTGNGRDRLEQITRREAIERTDVDLGVNVDFGSVGRGPEIHVESDQGAF